MMFLIKKKDKQNIVGHNELDYVIEYGWEIVKPLMNCPYSVKSMKCDSRSPKEIKLWFQNKIDENKVKMIKFQNELNQFNKMIDEDIKDWDGRK